jgi:hypothetical protein
VDLAKDPGCPHVFLTQFPPLHVPISRRALAPVYVPSISREDAKNAKDT